MIIVSSLLLNTFVNSFVPFLNRRGRNISFINHDDKKLISTTTITTKNFRKEGWKKRTISSSTITVSANNNIVGEEGGNMINNSMNCTSETSLSSPVLSSIEREKGVGKGRKEMSER